MTATTTRESPSSSSPSSATAAASPSMKQSANPQKDDAEYIPAHLRHYVFHSQDDFYVSRHFDPLLLSHLMYEGFLPIASEYRGECFLLPKLHRKRCILVVDAPEHVPKSVKKRGKKYKLALNQAFDAVVKGCHAQHGISWLYPPIVEGFRKLFEAGEHGIEIYPSRHVRFYSVELVDVETNAVVAGELGYTVGKTYTSLTGFSRVSGAGTVQLHALGRLLYLSGFQVWDLGMSMPYKLSLGAEDVDRDIFLEHLYRWRPYDCLLALQEAPLMKTGGGVHVKALFEISRPPRAISGIENDMSEAGAVSKKELHARQASSSSVSSNEEGDAEAEGKRNASSTSSNRGSNENSRHSSSTGGDKSDNDE